MTTGFKTSEIRGNNTTVFNYDASYASQMGLPASIAPPLEHQTTMSTHNAELQVVERARLDRVEKFAYDDKGQGLLPPPVFG